MADRNEAPYGAINWELIVSWLELDPADDGPFWALNLMKYHEVARYRDGREGVSGRQADDAYAPFESLAAVGAAITFVGDVTEQPLGSPTWDRIAIVRYPTRAAFLAMQERSDFKKSHEHKEAGMEFTTILSCEPSDVVGTDGGDGQLVMVVDQGGDPVTSDDGVVATLDAEGIIIGDERTYRRATFLRTTEPVDALVTRAAAGGDAFVVLLNPFIDQLAASITDATD